MCYFAARLQGSFALILYIYIRQIDNCHTSLCAYLKTQRIEPQKCRVRSEQFVTSQHFSEKKKKNAVHQRFFPMGILHGATMRHPGAQPSYGRTGHEVYSDAINVQERVIIA